MSDGVEQSPVGYWPMTNGRDTLLFGPERLNPEEASRLLARGPGCLVVWVGEEGAGKTSLCKALYECQRRPDAPTRFAGSWTLLAFEQLEQPGAGTATAAPRSDRHELDPDEREILHLALSAGGDPLHLLFADLPGPIFRKLADNDVSVRDVRWLARADKLALLVDGERLLDPALRSMALTRVRQLIERLSSSGLPDPAAGIALVVTKWDRVRDDYSAVSYWAPREAELVGELEALRPDVIAVRVATANRDDPGIAALCAWLLNVTPAPLEPPIAPPPAAPPAMHPPAADPLSVPLASAPHLPGADPLSVPLPSAAASQPVEARAPNEPKSGEQPVAADFWIDEALPRLWVPWRRRR